MNGDATTTPYHSFSSRETPTHPPTHPPNHLRPNIKIVLLSFRVMSVQLEGSTATSGTMHQRPDKNSTNNGTNDINNTTNNGASASSDAQQQQQAGLVQGQAYDICSRLGSMNVVRSVNVEQNKEAGREGHRA